MKNYQVYVISKSGRPLMPTKRYWKVRRLLKSGEAKVIKRKPFTIQLLYETEEYTQPLMLGIDPGGDIGYTVRKSDVEIVFAGDLETRSTEVAKNMAERKMHRQSRRQHRREKKQRRAKKAQTVFKVKEYKITGTQVGLICKYVKPKLIRFHNRCRETGWLTPTARHLLETHKRFIAYIKRMLPVTEVSVEYGKFDPLCLCSAPARGPVFLSHYYLFLRFLRS